MTDSGLAIVDVKNIEFYTLPRTKTVLWDHTVKGQASVLSFSSGEAPKLCLKENILQNVSVMLQSKQSQKGFGKFASSLLLESGSTSVAVVCHRYSGMPTCKNIAKEVEIPVLTSTKEEVVRWTLEDFYSDLKEIFSNSQNMPFLNLRGFFKIRIAAAFIGIHCNVRVEMATLSASFKVAPISPIPILHSHLFEVLFHNETELECSGFLALSKDKQLVHLSENQPELATLPLVGIWVKGIDAILHPFVWAACVRYISDPFLYKRICLPPLPFTVVIYSPKSTEPQFFDCTYNDPLCKWPNFGYFEGSSDIVLPKVPLMDSKILTIQLNGRKKSQSVYGAADELIERKELLAGPDVIITNTDDIPLSSHHCPYMRKVISPQHCVPDLSVVWNEGTKKILCDNHVPFIRERNHDQAFGNNHCVAPPGYKNYHDKNSFYEDRFRLSSNYHDGSMTHKTYTTTTGNFFLDNVPKSEDDKMLLPLEKWFHPPYQKNIDSIDNQEEYPRSPPARLVHEHGIANTAEPSIIPQTNTESNLPLTLPSSVNVLTASVSAVNNTFCSKNSDIGNTLTKSSSTSKNLFTKSCLKTSKKEPSSVTKHGSENTAHNRKNQEVFAVPSKIPLLKAKAKAYKAKMLEKQKSNYEVASNTRKDTHALTPLENENAISSMLMAHEVDTVNVHRCLDGDIEKKDSTSDCSQETRNGSNNFHLSKNSRTKHNDITSLDSVPLRTLGDCPDREKTLTGQQFPLHNFENRENTRKPVSLSFSKFMLTKNLLDSDQENNKLAHMGAKQTFKQTCSVATMTSFVAVDNMRSQRNSHVEQFIDSEKTALEDTGSNNVSPNRRLHERPKNANEKFDASNYGAQDYAESVNYVLGNVQASRTSYGRNEDRISWLSSLQSRDIKNKVCLPHYSEMAFQKKKNFLSILNEENSAASRFDNDLPENAFAGLIENDINMVGAILQKHGISDESPEVLLSTQQSVLACQHMSEDVHAKTLTHHTDHFPQAHPTNRNHHSAHVCRRTIENFRFERMFSIQSVSVLKTNIHGYNFGRDNLSKEMDVCSSKTVIDSRHKYPSDQVSPSSMPLSCMSLATQNYLNRYGLLPDEVTSSDVTEHEVTTNALKFKNSGDDRITKRKIWLFDETHRDKEETTKHQQ